MTVSSNGSPSPLSSRPTAPHSRNSDSNSTIRRSFSGNPFQRPSVLTNPKSFNPVTPANSPAGFGRRNYVGKEGMGQFHSCDEKENDKDQILKPVKVRSPANGSKNFMSPTISAASKFTPSPRKKPLMERNEPVRTSISLSNGKATFFSAISLENTEDVAPKYELLVEQQKIEDSLDSKVTHLEQNETVIECPPASKAMKKVTFAELHSDIEKANALPSDTVITDSDSLNVESDPQNKTSCFSSSHVIAPLDADPSVISPYDPKTNYLSPRPQFLHYKPKQRIEMLLHNKEEVDSEAKRLEDSFTLDSSSETFSDTDGAEESNSDDSNKDSEDSSAGNEEPEVKEEEEQDHCDKLDSSTPISHEITEEVVGRKKSFFTSLKFASLLLAFLIGIISISVTNSPVMHLSVPKSFSFSELHLPSGVSDTAIANFDAFTGRFKHLSFDSIYHLSLLVKNLGGHDNLSPLEFINQTDIHLPSGVSDTAIANFDAFTGRFKHLSFDSIYHLSLLVKNLGGHDNLSPLKFINLTDIQKDVLVGGHIHASGSSLTIGPTAHEVCENVNEGKGSQKFTGNFEQEDLEVQEEGESLPFEEETYIGVVYDDTSETDSDGEIDLGTQELTPAPVPHMQEPEAYVGALSDDTSGTEPDGEIDLRTQELTPAPVLQMLQEPEAYVGALSDDTSEMESDGEIDLETQELTSVPQMKEPECLETVWDQEEEASSDDTEVKYNMDVEDYVEALESKNEEKKTPEIQPELLETTKLVDGAIDLGSGASDITLSEMVPSLIGASENMLSPYYITGVTSIIVLALISAAAYVYLSHYATSSKPDPRVDADQLLRKKINPSSSVLEQIHKQTQNWPTEMDVMEESCSSEMSSFQTRSSSHSRLRSANEAQSEGRKPRKHSKRESLASSSEFSTGSLSYGSFTTYEKISSKNASGDEEIMTPVRRSSRIKNLVTSS